MYWGDWGREPKIERANMDGSGRRTLFNKNMGWPNGLVLDIEHDMMYWVDAKVETLEKAKLDGSERGTLIENLRHPYGLTFLDGILYWTDWTLLSILSYSTNNNSQRTSKTLLRNLNGLMDIDSYYTRTSSNNRPGM